MDDNTKKEEFSYGYIKMLAAVSGFVVSEASRALDNAGIDIIIKAPGQIKGVLSPSIDAQVKCTSRDIIKDNLVKFALPVNNYRRLIARSSVPQILIVVVVAKETREWLNIIEKQTLVRCCAYWISLKERKDIANKNNITIEIPETNLLKPEVLIKQIEQEAERLNRIFNFENLN
jgi:Domain of unknown function (DUF4365)